MISRTTKRFRKTFNELPLAVRTQARNAFWLFQRNPDHPSLRFKRVHSAKPVYSVRISRDYRALGVREGDYMVWFWAGSHDDYDKLIGQL